VVDRGDGAEPAIELRVVREPVAAAAGA
jgi:hypothetical protein